MVKLSTYVQHCIRLVYSMSEDGKRITDKNQRGQTVNVVDLHSAWSFV
jgi:hypothetical protein